MVRQGCSRPRRHSRSPVQDGVDPEMAELVGDAAGMLVQAPLSSDGACATTVSDERLRVSVRPAAVSPAAGRLTFWCRLSVVSCCRSRRTDRTIWQSTGFNDQQRPLALASAPDRGPDLNLLRGHTPRIGVGNFSTQPRQRFRSVGLSCDYSCVGCGGDNCPVIDRRILLR
jgi:hypothetical protein